MRIGAIGAIGAMVGLAGATCADAAASSFAIRATVPVHCKARLVRSPMTVSGASTVELGQLSEYCNAPRGYTLVIRYSAGSLAGTMIRIGEDTVVLNGSGTAVLSESRIPRIRSRSISATPGEGGLQTDRLELFMIPAA